MGPDGRVLRDAHGVRLEHVRAYDVEVEQLWAALTEPDQVARWLGRWSGDPATGTVELVMTEDDGATPQPVAVRECRAPARLALEMASEDGTWPLTVDLVATSPGSRLTFVHRMAEPYDATNIGPGWHYYLDRLAAVVAGEPVPDRWDDYWPALSETYALPD